MRIHGLSNQWLTSDQFCEWFSDLSARNDKARMLHQLLVRLESCDGPEIWAGISLSEVNLVYRDSRCHDDWVPPFATLGVVVRGDSAQLSYQIGFRVVEGKRPTDEWTTVETDDLDEAAALVMDAVAYATVHQRTRRLP